MTYVLLIMWSSLSSSNSEEMAPLVGAREVDDQLRKVSSSRPEEDFGEASMHSECYDAQARVALGDGGRVIS